MAVLKVKNGDEWIFVDSGTRTGIRGDMFAWAKFSDSGSLYNSSGVSSVSQTGGWGNYYVNFESPQPDMNYGTHVTPGNKPSGKTNSLCATARMSNGRSDQNKVNVYTSYYSNVGQNVDSTSVSLFRYIGQE